MRESSWNGFVAKHNDIANSPKTAAMLDKVYKIVDKKLDEQLSEGIDKATKKMEDKLEVVK